MTTDEKQEAKRLPMRGLNSYLRLACRLFPLIIFCSLFINCSVEKPIKQTVFVVKVLPVYDNRISREENYWHFQKFLFPQQEIPDPIPKALPNDDSVLFVSVDANGNIKLNLEAAGNVLTTDDLTSQLAYIFSERKQNGVYEPGNWKLVKVVGIKTAPSIKYGDFVKVVEAVKRSGAEPIVLLFNDDTKPKAKVVL